MKDLSGYYYNFYYLGIFTSLLLLSTLTTWPKKISPRTNLHFLNLFQPFALFVATLYQRVPKQINARYRYKCLIAKPPTSIQQNHKMSAQQMFEILTQQQQIHHKLSLINFLGLESLQSSLSDHATTSAYIQAIKNNQSQFLGKTVLHLTTGCNCIYSIYAARVGAAKVYCVINGHGEIETKNVYMMEQIVKQNKLQGVIEVKFYRDFSAQVDIIIGQPMGYNLIYDGLLDRMIQARDLHMKDKNKGLILPNKIRYKCAFIKDQHFVDKKVDFWNQVYGIPMKSMKQWISHQPIVRIVDPTLIVSEATRFIDYQTMQVPYQEIDNIRKNFIVRTPTDYEANGLAMWFQIEFRKPDGEKIQVKASPWCEPTRWTHMTLYSKKLWELKAGGQKKVEFSGKKNHIQGSVIMKLKVDGDQWQMYCFS